MLNEYLRLLARRESKEVLGKKSANLWLLTAVLAATFISIAFSNGSMIYLDEKMNDPFTNWVDIKNNKTGGTARLVRDLDDEALRERFLYDNVQQDHINSLIPGPHGPGLLPRNPFLRAYPGQDCRGRDESRQPRRRRPRSFRGPQRRDGWRDSVRIGSHAPRLLRRQHTGLCRPQVVCRRP